MKYITTVHDVEYEIEVLEEGLVQLNGNTYQVDFSRIDGDQVFSLLVNGRSYEAFLAEDGMELQVILEGVRYPVEVVDEHEKLLRDAQKSAGGLKDVFELTAPMPGLVVNVPVSAGIPVEAGDVLVILESMKMQNELKAPHAAMVTEVMVSEGDNVEKRDVLVVLGPNGDEEAEQNLTDERN